MSWGTILTKTHIQKLEQEEKKKETLEFLRQKMLKNPKNIELKLDYLREQGLRQETIISELKKQEKLRASRFPLDRALALMKEGKKAKEIALIIGFSADFTFKKLRKYKKKGGNK
jgi:hypothetical protein